MRGGFFILMLSNINISVVVVVGFHKIYREKMMIFPRVICVCVTAKIYYVTPSQHTHTYVM